MAMNFPQKIAYKILRVMARMMPFCEDISALVSKSMDRPLPLRQRLLIKIHWILCVPCRRYGKQLRLLRKGLSRYGDPDENSAEESLSLEAKERLKKVLAGGAK